MDRKYPAQWKENIYAGTGMPTNGDIIPVITEAPKVDHCKNCHSPKEDEGTIFGWQVDRNANPRMFNTNNGHDIELRAKLISSPCPVCQSSSYEDWLRKSSGLMGLQLDGRDALTIGLGSAKPGQEKAWEVAHKIIQFGSTQSLLLVGDNGTGKTHALMALVNGYRVLGKYSMYTTSAKMLQSIRDAFDGGDHLYAQSKYESAEGLAIDEIDRVKFSDWVDEKFFDILNTRFQKGLATWGASNKTPNELSETAEPMKGIVSRFSAGKIIAITGKDIRLELKE